MSHGKLQLPCMVLLHSNDGRSPPMAALTVSELALGMPGASPRQYTTCTEFAISIAAIKHVAVFSHTASPHL